MRPHTVPPRVWYAVLFFLMVMALVLTIQPKAFFTSDGGAIRPFGVRTDAGTAVTVFPLGVFTVLVAVLSLYVFTCIEAFA